LRDFVPVNLAVKDQDNGKKEERTQEKKQSKNLGFNANTKTDEMIDNTKGVPNINGEDYQKNN